MQVSTEQTLVISEIKNVKLIWFFRTKCYILFDRTYFSVAYFGEFSFSLKTTIKDISLLLIFVRKLTSSFYDKFNETFSHKFSEGESRFLPLFREKCSVREKVVKKGRMGGNDPHPILHEIIIYRDFSKANTFSYNFSF